MASLSTIDRALRKKFLFGDVRPGSKKHYWLGREINGAQQPAHIMFSHGLAEAGPVLVGKMARQALVPSGFFTSMVQCNHTCAEYEAKVLERFGGGHPAG